MKTETDQISTNEKSTVVEVEQNLNEQTNANKEQSGQSDKIIEEEEKDYFEDARCIEGNECAYICASKTCQQNAIVCGSKKCPCRMVHRQDGVKCQLIEPQAIVQHLQKKIIRNDKIQSQLNKLDSLLNKFIDQISEFQQTFKYFGLEKKQRVFLSLAHHKRYKDMRGSLINSVSEKQNALKIQENPLFNLEHIVKQYQNLNENLFEDMKSQMERISKVVDQRIIKMKNKMTLEKYLMIQNKLHKDQGYQYQRKICGANLMLSTINSFFKKSVKQYRLIYRASENNFSTERFWDSYKGQPNTLFVIKTEFNKIIGGYTPLVWEKNGAKDKVYPDPSKQSFIFSLTNNDRFDLVNSSCAIRYGGKQCGPIFGGSSISFSLKICNQSNIVNESQALFNCDNYKNNKYTAQNKQSYKSFNGSDSYNFRINQWAAFQVVF